MQAQIDINFEQLIKIVRKLPSEQLKILKAEIERKQDLPEIKDLKKILLKGPTATKKQLDIIANNRKAINQWRTN